MENSSFHSQLLSVMEVLATAAVGEINRRVDDSCAVLRLEVRQSRRDIDLLKKKCELMEAELRRSRIRARRRAAERFSPRVKVMLNKETPRSAWEGELEAEAHNHLQQCVDEADVHILIKEERSEENMWKSCSEDKLGEPLPCFNAPQPPQTDSFAKPHPSAETPADPGSVFSPVDPYASFPEQQQLNRIQVVAELLVKHERTDDPDEHAAPPPGLADPFGVEGRDGEPWSSADAGFSYGEPVPSTLASQSGLLLEDFPPQNRSVNAGAAREKRRFRMFGSPSSERRLLASHQEPRRGFHPAGVRLLLPPHAQRLRRGQEGENPLEARRARGREEVQLHVLRQELHEVQSAEGAPEEPHGGEALQLPAVRQELHQTVQPDPTRRRPQRGETLRVRHVWEVLHAALQPQVAPENGSLRL
ncbi:uncharacterized protein si:ch211-155e24.3 isoform X2 [Antennarius striatus]|uniref:uncharacterized protein si:ch211-155e24.3 isoform X2 n=1 Tax=Antennarius striatus TaxID=241820 RepID=UPI0035B2C406